MADLLMHVLAAATGGVRLCGSDRGGVGGEVSGGTEHRDPLHGARVGGPASAAKALGCPPGLRICLRARMRSATTDGLPHGHLPGALLPHHS